MLSDIDDCLDYPSDTNSVINFEKHDLGMHSVPLTKLTVDASSNDAYIEV